MADLAWRSGAQSDLDGIRQDNPRLAGQIALAVLDLVADPERGQPLERLDAIGDLADCRKLYVDLPPGERPAGPPRFRVVYRIDDSGAVQVVSIGPRADLLAYRRALVRLGRGIGRGGRR